MSGQFETEAAAWRLIEPGLWALDGTQMRIRLAVAGGIYYFVERSGHILQGAHSLTGAKMQAADVAGELQDAGIEP